jgi:proteic killer suppression protein
MQIRFANSNLARTCNSSRNAIRKLGPGSGKRLMQRLEDMASAENLAVLARLPGRAHPLTRGRASEEGQWSVDLEHPLRLVFVPDHDPVPIRSDGAIDATQITDICIVEVRDTHEDP